jgi:hypothetical protein
MVARSRILSAYWISCFKPLGLCLSATMAAVITAIATSILFVQAFGSKPIPSCSLSRKRQGSIKQDTRQYVSRLQHWGRQVYRCRGQLFCSSSAMLPRRVFLYLFSLMAIRRPLAYIRRSKTIQHVAARRERRTRTRGAGSPRRVSAPRLIQPYSHVMSPRRLALGSGRRPWALTPVLPSHSHLPECRLPRRRSIRMASPRRSQLASTPRPRKPNAVTGRANLSSEFCQLGATENLETSRAQRGRSPGGKE